MLEVQKQKRVSPFSSKLFSRLIAFAAAFLVFALLFGSMFQMFESISMQAMLRMNEEFSAQASTISDSMQSIINTLGIQMFYISSTAKLRKSTSLTQNERVFALRELWQYAMSGSMLHSIYVFNPKLDYVYTTDNDYMSASMDGFYDQDAVALYRQRSPENRMRLYHRTFRENGEDYGSEWYSYLVYEVTASGKTGESAVMLNLNADWFREHLLNFQGENYVIVSSDSYVVASQREELNAMSLSLLGRIGEQKRGYLIERLNGKRTICFFSPLDVNDWYCLRYVAYADCLPGLAKIRSYAWIALTLIACALLSALGVALIRVYDPYRRMTAALNRTHEVENVQQAAEQVEKIVATSLNRKREDALRLWVNGQPSEEGLVHFPAVPILLEMSPDERLRGLLAQETPDSVVCAVGEASLALCALSAGQAAVEICLHLATQMNCRCYYSLPVQAPAELPIRYQALLERKKLRFFYPGQQVFAQTAAESAGKSAEELETALAAEAAEEAVMVVPPAEEEQPVEEIAQEQEKPTKEGFFARLKRSLLKTKENLGSGFISLFRGKKIDDDLFEELEEQLLIADVGVETTRKIITNLTEGASRKQLRDAEALYGLLKEEMGEILAKVDEPLNVEGKAPFVILMVGVNGVGKTTTIGKLARQFEQQGKSVMLAAGDTFRAAAVEQLQVWGQRNNIPVIAQHTGADSASVIFDAIQAAKARNIDVLIADTAGRLQNKSHLMEELKKIVRVMKKLDVEAPHEVMLTIDASTGQNAVSQAKLFHEAVGLTGITLTKLDGTAKGGVIFSVADQFGIPIRYIGVGERIEDLRPFKADDFIEALFARED